MKNSLTNIVFILRQSPDWAKLASDYENNSTISPSRYKPSIFIEGFPDNIEDCINTWNCIFSVNFFRCRQVLKEIAINLLNNVEKSIVLSENDAINISSLLGDENFLLFFLDDDDWFAPDTFEKVTSLDLGQNKIAVFPLVRFDTDTFTFVRESETVRTTIGPRQNFHFRFQTNNYAITHEIALTNSLLQLKDHVAASHFAETFNIKDSYFDVLISATNKTPCSASKIPQLVLNPEGYKSSIKEYVSNLSKLSIPAEMDWCKPALNATISLFSSL